MEYNDLYGHPLIIIVLWVYTLHKPQCILLVSDRILPLYRAMTPVGTVIITATYIGLGRGSGDNTLYVGFHYTSRQPMSTIIVSARCVLLCKYATHWLLRVCFKVMGYTCVQLTYILKVINSAQVHAFGKGTMSHLDQWKYMYVYDSQPLACDYLLFDLIWFQSAYDVLLTTQYVVTG